MQDVDSKKAHTEVEKTWIACVRDMTYDVEDIIDEFTRYHMYEQQSGG